ncbi:MAG: 1-hydroxycarotenoid 3,4-desaturase CrtD [Pseudomonadota bacterium]
MPAQQRSSDPAAAQGIDAAAAPQAPRSSIPRPRPGIAHTRALVHALTGDRRRPARGRVVVVGAGFGGLAAALRLAAAGHEVTVLDSAAAPGGKARRVHVAGHAIDAGPTVFTMRWVFEALFAAAGTRLDDAVGLDPCRVLARHAWPDGTRFDLFADLDATAEAIAAFAGRAEAERYRRFAAHTERAYALFRDSFIAAPRPNPLDVIARIGLRGIPELIAVRPAANMYAALAGQLRDDRLRQLFARYATYCGSSPYRAPATLMLIAHVERMGVWRVRGGMAALAAALAQAIERAGGTLRLATPVAAIECRDGRAAAVRLADGERVACDAVVFNGDAAALSAGLLGPDVARATPRVPPARRSYSALVWSAAVRPAGFPLSHHTVFFGPRYREEFTAMDAGRLPRDATTYVCALDRDADAGAPPGGVERFHVQINAPATGDTRAPSPQEIETCRAETEALMAQAGLALSLAPQTSVLTTPADYHRLFPGTGGALYGAATHGPSASFTRPRAQTRVTGLFLAGGSAHPGAGVPRAARSGALAAAAVVADLAARARRRGPASTAPSPPAATAGGISTRSARTAGTG